MGEFVKFRCTECNRGLRVPEKVIGRNLACPFCKTLFKSGFEDPPTKVEVPSVPDIKPEPKKGLSSWVPTKDTFTNAASGIRSSAKSAAMTVSDAAVGAAKTAVTSATPFATTIVSAVIPGGGEYMAGKKSQGFWTLAAFLGSTGLAASTGGAWIAVPIAIRVFSSYHAAKHGIEIAEQMKADSAEENLREVERAAELLRLESQSMSPEDFERLMLEQEQKEFDRDEAGEKSRRVVLTRIERRIENHTIKE